VTTPSASRYTYDVWLLPSVIPSFISPVTSPLAFTALARTANVCNHVAFLARLPTVRVNRAGHRAVVLAIVLRRKERRRRGERIVVSSLVCSLHEKMFWQTSRERDHGEDQHVEQNHPVHLTGHCSHHGAYIGRG